MLLVTPHRSSSHRVLVDSGADEIFMDWRLADQLGLQRIPLTKPLEASALDGRLLCCVTHRTQTVQLTMAGNHTESISFHLFKLCLSPSHLWASVADRAQPSDELGHGGDSGLE